MKKIFISLLAVAALAACTKSEVQYEPAGEIGFAPVASNVTKSVAGYNGETFDGVFPTDVDLYVFANAQDENTDGTLADTWNTPYFQNALFEWNASKNESEIDDVAKNGSYAGKPTRYWPNVKSLKFAGYSDACNVAKTATFDIAANTITISSYTQDNANFTEEGTNDLMWFSCIEQHSKKANEVPVNMKHACSWITINVAGDDVTAENWTLNSLVVKALKHSGNVVCNATTAQWNLTGEGADEEYYKPTTGTTFTEEYVKYEKTTNNFIVLPQTPTSLDVTYTYTSQEATGTTLSITLTETKNVPLTFNGTDSWAPGVHYIYNVLITATEILIDPVVVDWTNYDGNEIDKTVN